MKIGKSLFCLALASVQWMLSGEALAQSGWPSRPLRLLVPLAAGSTADIISRAVGTELSRTLGQPVVVENKPGAGGTIAMAEVARSTPDGYTISFASQGTLVFNQALYDKPGYDSVKDFATIRFVGGVSNVMIVPPNALAARPADVVAQARAKPGTLTFSSGGSGTSHHLSGVLFGRMTSTELIHVPYKGAPQGILAVMSGEVSMGFFNTPTVISQIRDGKLKALAVTSLARSPLLPDVPTLDELGVKGYEVNTWFGFISRAGTPAEIVSRLHAEIGKVLDDPALRSRLAQQGFELAPAISPEQFSKIVADDLTKWVPLVKQSGARVD
ncbi:MAG: tripartite tricarboxylate transporter substrate binding protein [Oxalobacteraceae bacterium]|nr:tripartite tricarboxylate transporter substrate binding protein [Oxalobacteraceae bacterium]